MAAADSVSVVKEVFSPRLSEALAEEVAEKVQIPLVPSPIVTLVLKRAFQSMSVDLSPETLERLEEFLAAVSTSSKYDNFLPSEIDDLARLIATDLNPSIDVPILNEEQEQEVLEQVFSTVLGILGNKRKRNSWIKSTLTASSDLLGTDQDRERLVKAINAAFDVPLLSTDQEERVVMAAVDMCADLLQTLLPPQLLESLRQESAEGIVAMKTYVVDQVCEKVPLAGLVSEQQKRQLVEAMVEILIDHYVLGGNDPEMKLLLAETDEREILLLERKAQLEREMVFTRRRYEREQAALAAQLGRVDQGIRTIRRSRPLWRRIVRRFRRRKQQI